MKIYIDDEAAEAIVEYYTELRRLSKDRLVWPTRGGGGAAGATKNEHTGHATCCRALPVTARTLETIIRLATAACKMSLRFTISLEDVVVARSVLDHCLRNNVGEVGCGVQHAAHVVLECCLQEQCGRGGLGAQQAKQWAAENIWHVVSKSICEQQPSKSRPFFWGPTGSTHTG